MNQVRPLVGLQADEDRPAERGVEEKLLRPDLVPFPSHSSAFTIVTLEQMSRKGHEGGQVDAEDVVRRGPVGAGRRIAP